MLTMVKEFYPKTKEAAIRLPDSSDPRLHTMENMNELGREAIKDFPGLSVLKVELWQFNEKKTFGVGFYIGDTPVPEGYQIVKDD
jgi:hypothetical protein